MSALYHWTPELDAALREGYGKAASTHGRTAAIDIVVRMSGFPRYIVNGRARKLGLSRDDRKPWTPEEIDYLRRNIGTVSIREMAQHLGRGRHSVQAQAGRKDLNLTVRSGGISIPQAAEILGTSRETAYQAVRDGRLTASKSRISRGALQRFFWANFERLDLRMIDQRWLKETLRQGRAVSADSERAA